MAYILDENHNSRHYSAINVETYEGKRWRIVIDVEGELRVYCENDDEPHLRLNLNR